MNFREIKRVLLWILILNWLVAGLKIFMGLFTGSISIFADGLHSFFDGMTNVIGFFGVRLAEKPADKDHPYGHRKYEAVASMLILFFLAITVYETARSVFHKLFNSVVVDISWLVFAVLAVCLLIDYFVAKYEYQKGQELKSIILKTDSRHTKSHYITTGAVLLTAILIKFGLPAIIDPVTAILVIGFIIHLGCEIFKETAAVLSDKAIIDDDRVRKVVEEMLGFGSCHEIRTRGDEKHIFMDLHVVLDSKITLAEFHKICDELEEKIKAEIPWIKDITTHPEPEDREKS